MVGVATIDIFSFDTGCLKLHGDAKAPSPDATESPVLAAGNSLNAAREEQQLVYF